MKINKLIELYEKYDIKNSFFFFIGTLLYVVSFNLFLLPSSIVYGGIGGISILFQEIFNIEPAMFIFICQCFLLFVSFCLLGKKKTMNSVVGALLLPIVIKLTANVGSVIAIDMSHQLLVAVFGAVFLGIGLGFVYKSGFTLGGTDIINQIMNKYLRISMGKALMITDLLIIICGILVFGFTKGLYALVILYITGTLVDKVLLGISNSKAFYIITTKDQEVIDYIIRVLNRGVTIFKVKGGYKGKKDQVLFCVVPTSEYYKLRVGVREIDETAFFVVTDAYEVYGGE